ncbi:hypothetical protein GCM10017044_28490 [Kordiimonas sediminis]|uniref:DUF502 domain-containing protein n=1 Tax=Kordiimonas sediminis TaxID=1735581 RepID=A0A919AZH0_9PROT|nr:DUF502 domain-containing protein [Kordiimonas sediminis]GHF31293.1 hypothetical protein GCM10017044_28490 [Kordiimonas sediminis]
MSETTPSTSFAHIRRYIFLGLFTLIPIWLTLLLTAAILDFINDMAAPVLNWLTAGIEPDESLYRIANAPAFRTTVSLCILLLGLYTVGLLASRWLGQKLLGLLDAIVKRVPIVNTIYKTLKRLTEAMQSNSDDFERVVLIEFPSKSMKTVGLVTKTFKDTNTGRELAAVYVPTTPNPTSGYLEIVPVENLVPTNWKIDEAMSFIISGGADVPGTIQYDNPTSEENGKQTRRP